MKKTLSIGAVEPGSFDPYAEAERRAELDRLHVEAARLAARGRPEELRRWFVEARPVYGKCSLPGFQGFRLYYLGALRRDRYQFKSAAVLLSAAAQRFSRAGQISNAAQALVGVGEICREAGWLEELSELRERLLAMLAVDESSCLSFQPLLWSAVMWAEQLGMPVGNTEELAALVRTRRRASPKPGSTEPGCGAMP